MPPAAEESHPPPGVLNEPEGAEGEETDEYDIEEPEVGEWFVLVLF